MKWYTRHRLEWIAEALRVYGFINRDHLIRKFGISTPQASKDLQAFQQWQPKAMVYDLKNKHYAAAGNQREHYVNERCQKAAKGGV